MSKTIDSKLFDELLTTAHESPRKRSHHNLHSDFNQPVQRVVIGLANGTYVHPHMHPQSHKWEMTMALKGRFTLLFFSAEGEITKRYEIGPDCDVTGIEVPAGTWHTLFPTEGDAVIMEVKEGPFKPEEAAEFADWAPAEGSDDVAAFLEWAKSANVSDCFELEQEDSVH